MSNKSARVRVWLVIQTIIGVAALSTWFGYIAMFEHFDATRPTTPDAGAGRIIPQNNHGHVVYLTEREEKKLLRLQYCSIGLVLPGTLVLYIYRKERQENA